ncbi:MAG TPA: hypothetical protein VGY31_09690 [Terriglobia bacterium]|nr:hypothetical protein [Terriglobia bacterium]
MTAMNDNQFPTAKWGILAMLMALPVLIVFAFLGDFRRGVTAWICAGLLIGAVKAHWFLRKHAWFWVTVTILAVAQAPFVIFFPVPMSKSFTAWELLPVAILDFGVMYGCIKLLAKFMKKRKESSG